ncbi:putative protein RETICULATA-RELATED 3, chloroplastic [Iris pallida]|uniref:Uncharacterized protein n=1 Tax=Iris pallida TaxID=29817 RepID=A0AAX6H4J6_IRIPA|nr:putative protein RETICULATA-RELATED 3, chloroplastic [Iris pallida]
MAASQLRFSPLSNTFKNRSPSSILSTRINPISVRITRSSSSSTHSLTTDSGNSGFHGGGGGGDSGGNNSGWSSSDGGDGVSGGGSRSVADAFFSGWRSRVAADPEFPFKVLMEEVVGVSATAVGDMASRPNFGLSELDLVLSTLVVGSIVNFVLMYSWLQLVLLARLLLIRLSLLHLPTGQLLPLRPNRNLLLQGRPLLGGRLRLRPRRHHALQHPRCDQE